LNVNLAAYFARIGYTGARTPTLDTLGAIQLAHAQSIAFENLTPLMGKRVPLDLPSLEEKLVRGGRGGYCFEQNGLLAEVLREIGFEVTGLAARVLWGGPEDAVRMRSHMLLKVEVGAEPYLLDVGFGGQTPTGPLRFTPDVEQATPHEPFRLVALESASGPELKLQSRVGGAWKSLYRFDFQPQYPPDYEMANHFTSTHPDSPFRTGLRMARPFPGGRYAMLNNQLTVHRLDGSPERRTLASVAEVRASLESVFGLTLPEASELDPALARACGLSS
jgi:N-hydroxyarylamine O-acetyltransferase